MKSTRTPDPRGARERARRWILWTVCVACVVAGVICYRDRDYFEAFIFGVIFAFAVLLALMRGDRDD